ncbi:Maf family protein [Thermocrinis minervae]|uniref:dTTP/UTP pyrophosphatase n=1 Tax=Thermocrinis minervae TaxID=381751 RepID=A0A1M6QN06_9AQUI|nr:Maf family protein [Thermocrinis minervae]SHK21596.1 septum formation protein [Thermocrinis minervae]
MRFLILASESKRRVDILRMLGFQFSVIPSRIKEETLKDPVLTARFNAKRKALSVWKEYKFATVLAADTVVYLDGKVYGKPRDEEEAKRFLLELSGRWHRVVSAVCILSQKGRYLFHKTASVKMRELTKQEIEEYVKTGEPLDKAGAYAIQGFGAALVESIRGDFYTVMGLPISETYWILKKVLD